jgi:ribosomal protein S18 acetylase RimI-like enzyme
MARYVFFSDAPFLVGYTLYFYTYSTWDGRVLYMEDLYVKPEFRGNKIGTQLWKAVTKVTNTIWYVYVYFSTNSRKMNTEKCAVSGYGCLMQVLTVC